MLNMWYNIINYVLYKGAFSLDERFLRNEMLIGKENQRKLNNSSVIIFGVGGVGSSVAESLARSGVGNITLVDKDVVDITNINRQLHAISETVGKPKTEAMAERIKSINPEAQVKTIDMFYLPENANSLDLTEFDYIIDAIDTVSSKIELACRAEKLSVPIISCMGTGNKLHPEELKIADIYKTKVCPLCRVMRRELLKRNVKKLTVVYSEEKPRTPFFQPDGEHKRNVPASMPFVPPVAGMIIASRVVSGILSFNGGEI